MSESDTTTVGIFAYFYGTNVSPMNNHIQNVPTIKPIIVLFVLLACQFTGAFNIRQSTNSDGLTSSAVLTVAQDSSGFLWLGTLDGVCVADGLSITPFSKVYPGLSLSGNLIEKIVCAGERHIWISTNHGLDRLDKQTATLLSFPQFNGQEHLCVDSGGNLYVIGVDNAIYYFDSDEDNKDFRLLTQSGPDNQNVKSVAKLGEDLVVFGGNGVESYRLLTDSDGRPGGAAYGKHLSDMPVKCAHQTGKTVLVVTDDNRIVAVDRSVSPVFVTDISDYARHMGDVSDITYDINDNIYVSFSAKGVLRLHKTQTNDYVAENLGINAGIFCLERSSNQPVVWIGSDCRGLFTCYDSPYAIRTYSFSDLGNVIGHPVRSIHYDGNKSLWLGTKGGGILKINNFDKSFQQLDRSASYRLFTTDNSELNHNSVYAFAASSRPLLWIASEEGLNYYSYTDNRIHKVTRHPAVRYIHSIYEENDSTLWLASVGNGIIRCRISPPSASPDISIMKFYTTDGGRFASNYFFSMSSDTQGRLLFGNRGKGAFVLKGDTLSNVRLNSRYEANAINDVFAVAYDGTVKWLGTGSGLLKVSDTGEKLFLGRKSGFTSNTVHDIETDAMGSLWVSTNNGLYRFDPRTEKIHYLGRNEGVSVNEFSDGSGFNSKQMLFFGGTDGFVTVSGTSGFEYPELRSEPIVIHQLQVLGKNVLPGEYLSYESSTPTLTLKSDEKYFTVTFSTPDFLSPLDYHYLYSLDGREWIDNDTNGAIHFTEMGYGEHRMQVKYANRMTGEEGQPFKLDIHIKPPLYLTGVAKAFYIIMVLGLLGCVTMFYLWRLRKRRTDEMAAIEQKHKENMYEEKLRFFTNITHEFCTPLTLIYGPCERISSYGGADEYIKKYIGIVKTNAERLNSLIQELIDFRRIETGHEVLKIRTVNLSDLCSETVASFSDLAERNGIEYTCNIEPDILWNTDFSSVRKILNNLIFNAFKYTNQHGKISVDVYTKNNRVVISVYNTGKGISEENKRKVFNRYSVLDNVEENAVKGTARNGLGLAICYGMVNLLNGNIDIDSVVGEYARFNVSLPPLKADSNEEMIALRDPINDGAYSNLPGGTSDAGQELGIPEKMEKGKYTILVIDDNRDILTLLRDSLGGYNVISADSAETGLKLMKKKMPDLVITDIMMPGQDGLGLAHQIKSNRHTMHIPVVILSAKTSEKERTEGIEQGADAYVSKPFSVKYLNAVISRLLESRKTLREYYNSSASAFEYIEDNLIGIEDKDFLEKAMEYVDAHIEDSVLTPQVLADAMQMSIRKLYRKFKDLNQPTPNDFIKNMRIAHAAKLLLTTSNTIQEIIYMTGFTNRSHFYSEFDKRYGMTPKEYRKTNKVPDSNLGQ